LQRSTAINNHKFQEQSTQQSNSSLQNALKLSISTLAINHSFSFLFSMNKLILYLTPKKLQDSRKKLKENWNTIAKSATTQLHRNNLLSTEYIADAKAQKAKTP